MRNPEFRQPIKEKKEPKIISRRNILKGLGIAGILTLLSPGKLFEGEMLKKSYSQKEVPKKEPEFSKLEKQILEKIKNESQKILEVNNYEDILNICKKVEGYKEPIEKYAKKYNIMPGYLYGLIFTESKGDPKAYNTNSGAKGLCQFTANTAKEFELSNRENPDESIKAAAKFINYYQKYLGTQDLAVASFHMGYGNMFDLISNFIKPDKINRFPKEAVASKKLNYSKIYFGADKITKPETHDLLFNKLKDDSANYYFKILAATSIINMANKDTNRLKELSMKASERKS